MGDVLLDLATRRHGVLLYVLKRVKVGEDVTTKIVEERVVEKNGLATPAHCEKTNGLETERFSMPRKEGMGLYSQ
jgi:hypothetical protein